MLDSGPVRHHSQNTDSLSTHTVCVQGRVKLFWRPVCDLKKIREHILYVIQYQIYLDFVHLSDLNKVALYIILHGRGG